MAVVDSSGQKNHASNAIVSGPGLWGRGASAFFNGYDYVEIPHSTSFAAAGEAFSVTAWVYLMDAPARPGDAAGRWCPIVHKGAEDAPGGPALLVHTNSRKMKFESRRAGDAVDEAESTAKLPMQRWMHVAMVRTPEAVSLYVNGIMDSSKPTAGNVGGTTEDPLYIGAVPWLRDACSMQTNVDEVRYYSRALTTNEIQAEAAPALGGIPPAFLHLGCASCTVGEAAAACREDYHLCTQMELHAGGYQVARIMGYATWETQIWTHADSAGGGAGKKLAMCCTDLL
jgi:hypothetical protein